MYQKSSRECYINVLFELLSSHISGFQKLYGCQHCLLKVLENWENALHKGDFCLVYWSRKRFWCYLLLAKLKNVNALTLMCSFQKKMVNKDVQ